MVRYWSCSMEHDFLSLGDEVLDEVGEDYQSIPFETYYCNQAKAYN